MEQERRELALQEQVKQSGIGANGQLDAMTLALMNEVFEDGRAATKYETDMLSEGDHVLFITFQSGDESIGLEHFVGPIRSSAMATSQDGYCGPPIFVLGPARPA